MNVAALFLAIALQKPPAPQPGAPPPRPNIVAEPAALMIAAFDADTDAEVSRAEFDAGVRKSFADAAADGEAMSLIEFSSWSRRWLGNQGALPGQFDFDSDGDDRISWAEYAAEFGRRFAKLDVDKDDALSRAELMTVAGPAFEPLPKRRRRR